MKKLPAGLEGSIEIYRSEKVVRALVNGNRMDYLELPSVLREPFQAELIGGKSAMNCLMYDMKIIDPDLLEEKFVSCRYGALDSTPDLTGRKTCHDFPCCDSLKDCPGFDIVCKIPPTPVGKLSRQEYIVMRLVAQGKLDKEISLELSIEISTVKTYLARIREKLCVNNRIEIAFWAMNKGI
jgi:DNA-binding CsgD family transcriptional regulator